MEDNKHKGIYEEYYGVKEEAKEEEKKKLGEFHKKVLELLGKKGNTSDKIAKKLKVRENDVRRALNELLVEKLVSYKKTTTNGKLAYTWKKRG